MSSSRVARLPAGYRHVLVLTLLAVLAASFVGTATPVGASAAQEQVKVATADSTVHRGLPTTNLGARQQLTAKGYRARFYVRFDVSAWYGKSIDKLTLRLKVNEGNLAAIRLRPAATSWSAITWLTRPSITKAPVLRSTAVGVGTFDVNFAAFFPNGRIDRREVAFQASAINLRGAVVASRESGSGPRLILRTTTTQTVQRTTDGPQRFYHPNIIVNDPARNTSTAQLERLFSSYQEMKPVLDNVDVYGFFGGSVAKGDPLYDAMLRRAIPMLSDAGVKISVEVGGPLGYAPAAVYGADRNGENGRKSALHDLATRVSKIEGMGGRVNYLMLDGALRRTIRNGTSSSPHNAFLTLGRLAVQTALKFRARVPGSQGNSIRMQFVVGAPGQPLEVAVSGRDITVRLAADSTGRVVSTAAQVKVAVEASTAASALVTVAHEPGSNGTGTPVAAPLTPLAWGDDGINMSISDSVEEVVSYVRTMHAARPNIRFVLVEDVILWPYDGKAGYSGAPYPSGQRPDFKDTWTELIRQLKAAGLLSTLAAMHNDVSVEYLDRQVGSPNSGADDWYGRILKQQKQVESSGVAFGQFFNSQFGGNPQTSPKASDRFYQEQVLHFVDALETYRQRTRPDMEQMDDFIVEGWMTYPRVISPSSVQYSFDDTYLDALRLYQSLVRPSATTSLPVAA